MDDVALLSATERAEIFQQTAAQKSISSAIAMEKDFWVCWILRRIFDPPLVEGMVFKGGTSLSKVYKAIARFSEDVDLSIPREALGFSGTHDLTPGISRTRQDHLLMDMREACERHVSGSLRESLTERIAAALPTGSTSTRSLDVADSDAATLLFAYPPALPAEAYGAGGYIRPIIRLEFGGRNEVWPAEVHTVRPYCLEEFPTLSEKPSCDVNVLAAERTFGKGNVGTRRVSSARIESAAGTCVATLFRSGPPDAKRRQYTRDRTTGAVACRCGAQGAVFPLSLGAVRRGIAGKTSRHSA